MLSSLLAQDTHLTPEALSNVDTYQNENTIYTMQLGLDLTFTEWFTAELVIESEYDRYTHSYPDERLINVELDEWGLTPGRFNLPFGEYFSHFATGPMLEFGKNRADAFIIDYTVHDQIEIATTIYFNS